MSEIRTLLNQIRDYAAAGRFLRAAYLAGKLDAHIETLPLDEEIQMWRFVGDIMGYLAYLQEVSH